MKTSGYRRIVALALLPLVFGLVLGIILSLINQTKLPFLSKFVSVSRVVEQETGYNKFIGPHERFFFEYPAKWRVTRYDKKSEYIFDYPEDLVTVFVVEQSYTITEGSVEKNFAEGLEKQKTELASKNYTNFSQSKYKQENRHFFRLDYDLTPLNGINRKGIFLYIVKPKTFYSISMGVSEPKYVQVISDFEHLIQSFR
jgi:hypothetical protein